MTYVADAAAAVGHRQPVFVVPNTQPLPAHAYRLSPQLSPRYLRGVRTDLVDPATGQARRASQLLLEAGPATAALAAATGLAIGQLSVGALDSQANAAAGAALRGRRASMQSSSSSSNYAYPSASAPASPTNIGTGTGGHGWGFAQGRSSRRRLKARRFSEEVMLAQDAVLCDFPAASLPLKRDKVAAMLRAARREHAHAVRVHRARAAELRAGLEAAAAEALERLRRASGRLDRRLPLAEVAALREALSARMPISPRFVALVPYEKLEAVVRGTMSNIREAGDPYHNMATSLAMASTTVTE